MDIKIKLPDLTRKQKRIGRVHEDLKIDMALYRFHGSFGRHWPNNHVKNLFLPYYNIEDAIYRRDFLSEIIENNEFKKSLNKVYRSLAHQELDHVRTHDWSGDPFPDKFIRQQISNIKKYISVADTLELMAEFPGNFEVVKDLRNFAKNTRKQIEEYNKFVEPIKKSKEFKDRTGLNIRWANKCVDEIKPFYRPLEEIMRIRGKIKYYKMLSAPYEMTYEGEKIPSCKPEFLDPELRKGKIINAYNPRHFSYGDIGKYRSKIIVEKLNIPNDIEWGDNARNTFIQGPNSMGKTVYLNTLALNIHMAMAGLRCFADYCEMSPVGRIYPCFDMGDSLREGHFVTGAYKIQEMKENVTINDIVLLDEAGGGTEPEAERAISKGLSDALIKYGYTSFNVTHDREAWKDHINQEGVRFLRVADLDDKQRKFKVWEGIAERGYAMKIAEELGIDPKSVEKSLNKNPKV